MTPTASMRETLQRFAILNPIADEPEMLDTFAAALTTESFSAGVEIVRKGESTDCAYLLISGAVEVRDYTLDSEPYTRDILTAAEAPIFGEMGLLGAQHRTATVIAREPCECWKICRSAFHELGDRAPRIGWLLLNEITAVLARRLDKANADVLTLFEALVHEIGGDSAEEQGQTT
jgi:CRP-like cAMP-binding protein